MAIMRPDMTKSALIIVDMQNDFLHPEGAMGKRAIARESPETTIDLAFLRSTIPRVKKLANAFRKADRPVIYIAHILKSDYSDAAFPYWLFSKKGQLLLEDSWGAQIVDELKPRDREHLLIKKGYNAFSNTPLDTILRNLNVSTCVVTGVTTSVCVSSTVRGGVEYNYRMIMIKDATAEVNRELHEAEVKILARSFAEIMTFKEIVILLENL
jgi:nicotinamidase-related amidase